MPEVPSQTPPGRANLILLADDDLDDRMFIRRALEQIQPEIELREVADGEDLMDYLLHEGLYADPDASPRPDLIFLDLNMPRMGGLEALKRIKAEPMLRQIPVVVLTTSHETKDIQYCYDQGANAFVTKPMTMEPFIRAMQAVGAFWFSVATTPKK